MWYLCRKYHIQQHQWCFDIRLLARHVHSQPRRRPIILLDNEDNDDDDGAGDVVNDDTDDDEGAGEVGQP